MASNAPKTDWRIGALIGALILVFVAAIFSNLQNPRFADQSDPTETAADTTQDETVQADANEPFDPFDASNPIMELELTSGTVRIEMRKDLAPNHVAQLQALADEGFYDGIVFHRVIEGFMAQTGDPTGTGMGSSELPDIDAEFTDASFVRGTVGMARSSNPNSANSQFFIMFEPAPHLEGSYTVIGQVLEGMAYIDQIKKGSPQDNGTVTDPDSIVSLKITSPN